MQDRAQPTHAKFTHEYAPVMPRLAHRASAFAVESMGRGLRWVNKAGSENVANLQDEDTPRDRGGKSCELHAGARICAS